MQVSQATQDVLLAGTPCTEIVKSQLPSACVNEACSWRVFDAHGAIDPHAAHAIDAVAAPTEAQWAKLRALVFGNVRATTDTEITP